MKLVLFCWILFPLFITTTTTSQPQPQPTTHPSEVRALNSIFQQWGISALSSCNTSGEPCTGAAIDNTEIRTAQLNPGIKCDCYYNNQTPCHINQLKVQALNVRGVISEELRNLPFLTWLDFGSNNFSGSLPPQLGSLVNLQHIYMDSSGVGGVIPNTFANLVNMQSMWASDNPFTGNIPDFIGNWSQLSSLNVIANNLTLSSSNNSTLASELSCLQRQLPCSTGAPRYSSFAIKCGGPQMQSNDGTVYEAENLNFTPAVYRVTSTRRWALSNVGLYSSGPSYLQNTLAQTTGTLDPELFQTARLSPGSLRYYGLGLENGEYNVNLQFAETGFHDASTRTWQSLGRRLFDIYLQESLRVKDFNIRDQAGGAINRAVVRDYTVQVSQNFLEIHLFWAGKGTCCITSQGYYGPLISAIRVTANFEPTVSNLPPTSSTTNRTGLIVGITVSIVLVIIICALVIFYLRRKKARNNEEEDFLGIENTNTFSYAELRNATGDFSPTHKLGEGGFGPVYKGVMSDGKEIAVKKLLVSSHQGKSQFVAEISTISAVQHRNLVKLYGCCIEGANRLLVYEYLKNKSLDQALFGKSALHLDWSTRYNICLGAARGLAYLHEESDPRIVHRDVKASNILLDTDLNPKISDFGLAKVYDDKKTHISTRVAGTFGYLCPEYAMRGHLTEKADVFGFGVVALEVLCGRPIIDASLDPERIYLLEWAWSLYENDRGMELVDPTLTSFNEEEAIRMLRISLLCTQASPMMRPSMSRVVAMLIGDIQVRTVTSKPSYLSDWQFNDMGTFMSHDGTSKASNSHCDSSNASTVYTHDIDVLPAVASRPLLHDVIDEER